MKMMSVDTIYEQFKKLDSESKKYLIFWALCDKEIKFEEVSEVYVKYLEKVKKSNRRKESLFADCLASSISNSMGHNIPFFESQAYVLLKDWMPTGWLTKYLTEINDKDIAKNLELLQ